MTTDTWNLDPPPGFRGLRDDKPLTVYHRHLPHWRQDGATYFVTFRLADALPQSKLRELEALRGELEARYPPPRSTEQWEAIVRQTTQSVETWLDAGLGACWLREARIATAVASAWKFFDGQQYELGSYVIMPNHMHLLVRPLNPQSQSLEQVLHSRKLYTAHETNRQLGRRGAVWQEESFDRIVRDEEHLYRCLQYIGSNPRKAGIPAETWVRWVRPEWEELGWRFED